MKVTKFLIVLLVFSVFNLALADKIPSLEEMKSYILTSGKNSKEFNEKLVEIQKTYDENCEEIYSILLKLSTDVKLEISNTSHHEKSLNLLKEFQLLNVKNNSEVTNVMKNLTALSLLVYDDSNVPVDMKNKLLGNVEELKKNLRLAREKNLYHDETVTNLYFGTKENIQIMDKISRSQSKSVEKNTDSVNRINSSLKKSVDSSSDGKFQMISVGFLFLLVVTIIVKLNLKVKSKQRLIDELEGIDHTFEVTQKSQELELSGLEKLKGISVVVINEEGFVEKATGEIKNLFNNVEGKMWDEFFTKKFQKEENIKSLATIYKLRDNVKDDWMIESSIDQNSKKRYCWLKRIDARVFTQIAKNRNEILESSKYHIGEYLEILLAQKYNYWKREIIKLEETNYVSDMYLYANESEAQKLIQKVVDVTSVLARLKFDATATMEVRRSNKTMEIKIFIPFLKMQSKDFSRIIRWNGVQKSITEILKLVENTSDSLSVSTLIKNTTQGKDSGLSFEVTVNDNESLRWLTRRHRVETTC